MNNQKIEAFLKAAMPLMEWLAANCHPHCKVVVDSESAELMEGLTVARRTPYVQPDLGGLVARLQDGCVQVPRRWTGDCGEMSMVDEQKTDELMRQAAQALTQIGNL